jgi:hypothetical protein
MMNEPVNAMKTEGEWETRPLSGKVQNDEMNQ